MCLRKYNFEKYKLTLDVNMNFLLQISKMISLF